MKRIKTHPQINPQIQYDTVSGTKVSSFTKSTHNEFFDVIQAFDEIVNHKMSFIEQISLEDEDYNDLYLGLKEVSLNLKKVIRAQYRIDTRNEKAELWESMKELRDPNDDFKFMDKLDTQNDVVDKFAHLNNI